MKKIKAVRIMCDHCAGGVWSAPSVANSSMDGFWVSDALWARIQAWQAWYETQNVCVPIDTEFDWDGFTIEGLMIARAVKAELPDWVVIYSDEQVLNFKCYSKNPKFWANRQFSFEIEIGEKLH